MAIEKLDFTKVTHQKLPFTQIFNKVIQNIKNAEAFMIWAYLASLPSDWNVCKEQLKKKFGYGIVKMRQVFSYLHRANLVEYSQERKLDGTVGNATIHVLCGDLFDIDEPWLPSAKIKSISPVISPVRQKTAPPVNRPYGKQHTTNKQIHKEKSLKQKKQKSFSAHAELKKQNKQKHEFADSMNQMANEAKHIEEHENRKKEETKVVLSEIGQKTMDSIKGLLNKKSIRTKNDRVS